MLGGVVGRQPYILGWSPLSTRASVKVCAYISPVMTQFTLGS